MQRKNLLIYLDNCCYNRPYDNQSDLKINIETLAKLDIQERIRNGSLYLASSYVLEAENSVNPFIAKREDIQNFIDKYSSVYISKSESANVYREATVIMDKGVKLMDACHLACAILSKCDVFLTTDKRILKYQSDDIKIMNPAIFVLEGDDLI